MPHRGEATTPGEFSFPRKYLEVQEVPTQSAQDLELMFGRTWKIDCLGGGRAGGSGTFYVQSPTCCKPSGSVSPPPRGGQGQGREDRERGGAAPSDLFAIYFLFQVTSDLKDDLVLLSSGKGLVPTGCLVHTARSRFRPGSPASGPQSGLLFAPHLSSRCQLFSWWIIPSDKGLRSSTGFSGFCSVVWVCARAHAQFMQGVKPKKQSTGSLD